MNIEVDKSAKVYAASEIIIEASSKKVYHIISDINNWTVWQAGIKKSHIEGEPAEGKSFEWKSGLTIKSKLHTVNPYSDFGWTGKMMWISAIHNWKIEEVNGKCKVTVSESLSGFLSGIMLKSLEKQLTKSLFDLKTYAEKE